MTAETERFRLGTRMVSRIGYGAMQLTGPGVFGPPADEQLAISVLRAAQDAGVDHIDTAQFYGPSVVNDLIRIALYPYHDDLAIVSKVGAARGPRGEIYTDNSPGRLLAAIEENLRTLGTEQLAAVNLRMPDQTARPDALFDDQLAVMVGAREAGLIGGIGLSNISLAQLEHALAGTEIVTVQNSYSLGDRRSADVLELTTAQEISFVPFLPLGWAGAQRDVLNHPTVLRIAVEHGVTPAQIAQAWLLALAPNVLLITGTGSLDHLHENLAAGAVRLTASQRNELSALVE